MSNFVFRNFNGIYQLRLETADDLPLIHQLEEPRWRATSAPLEQLFCDAKFLEFVDTDKNGRIRVNEVKAAHLWLYAQLTDRAGVVKKSETLSLAALDPRSPEVPGMKSLAERIIRERAGDKLAATSAAEISLTEVRAFRDSYAKKFPNGDGVLTSAQAADASVKPLLDKVLEATGGAADLSGDKGIRTEDLDAFLASAKAYIAWEAEAHPEGAKPGEPTAIEPLGADTAKAAALIGELAPKIDQFFALCDLLAIEANAKARLDASAEVLAALDLKNTAALRTWVESSPIARPVPEAVLDLGGAINPHYAAKVATLVAEVLPRAKKEGSKTLVRADWEALQALVKPYVDWQAKKPAGVPAGLGTAELKALIEGPATDTLRAQIVQDQEASSELKEIANLEKLILFQRWFMELVNNFVSFPNLFIPGERSLFEMGTLILDGRAMSLSVLVTDRASHKKVAEESLMFVVYVELTRKEGDQTITREVASAVTAGTRGGIAIGKRGVFYDRDKKEWDARVVDMIIAPVSLYEAAIAPFVRLRTFVGDRIQKMTAGKLESMETSATKKTELHIDDAATKAGSVSLPATTPPPQPPPQPAPQPAAQPAAAAAPGQPGGVLGTILVGGSVALAAIGSTVAFVVKTLSEIQAFKAIAAVLSVVLAIAALSGFLGWLKLRRRDLSVLLEACGWALNGRMFLTRRLSLLFTQEPELPEGSKTELPLITSRYIVATEKRQAAARRRYLFRALVLGLFVLAAVYWQEIWSFVHSRLGG